MDKESSEYGSCFSLTEVFGIQREHISATWYGGVIGIGVRKNEQSPDDPAFALFPVSLSSKSTTDVYFRTAEGRVRAVHKVNNRKDGGFLSRTDCYWVYSTVEALPSTEK